MSCPDHETWASYLRGAIDGEQADALREHLDTCAACRGVVAKASAGDAPSSALGKLGIAVGVPVIAFKEPDPASAAVTVRPGGDDPPSSPRPAVTLVPSGEDE